MTTYPELFARLAKPFETREVKTRPQGKIQISYVTARTVMNRLDNVLGPENWWDDYPVITENSVICRLTIRLPDGSILAKVDAGGAAGMADAGDDDKSMLSDAFKRAAVKFGVGRYLYRDGVPDYAMADRSGYVQLPPRHTAAPRNGNGDGASASATPARGDWNTYIADRLDQARKHWSTEMGIARVPKPDQARPEFQLPNVFQLTNHLVSHALETGAIRPSDIAKEGKPEVRDSQKAKAALAAIYAKAPKRVRASVDAYLLEKQRELRVALGMDDLEPAAEREPGCDDDL